jgi:hypothetical protein
MKPSSVISAALATPRPGSKPATPRKAPAPAASEGLELSDIEWKPLGWFKLNPANDVFRKLKTAQYYADLERDIRKDGIINALVAMPDGLLIEGESRLIVAERIGLARLPVRIVLSTLMPVEQERRLLLGNLGRFEIDEDTRIALYCRVWPGYFRGISEDGPTRAEIAAAAGKSERQTIRDAKIGRAASKIASEAGKDAPDAEDVKAARAEAAAKRREGSTSKYDVLILKLQSALDEIERRASESLHPEGFLESADIIREAAGL